MEIARSGRAEDVARLQAELTAAEEEFVAALAEQDRVFALEISVFRDAVEDIASSPEGAAALTRLNAGDELGALAVLDDLRATRGDSTPETDRKESCSATPTRCWH